MGLSFDNFLALLGPASAAVVLALYLSLRSKVNPDKFLQSITERVTELEGHNTELTDKIEVLQKQLIALQIENAELLAKITLLESAHQSLPLPMWLKDQTGRVLSINQAYEEQFLIPRGYSRNDYVGHYDSDVWPEEIAAQFMVNDRRVFKDQQTWVGSELVPNSQNENERWQIVKYVRYAGTVAVGIGGIAVPQSVVEPD